MKRRADIISFLLERFKKISLARVLEVSGFLIALVALWFTYEQLVISNEQAELNRKVATRTSVSEAWQIVTSRTPGNSGKKQALETLLLNSESLSSIDLSCKTMTGGWKESEHYCEHPTYLKGLDLSGASPNKFIALINVNLNGADLDGANLSWTNMGSAKFAGAFLRDTDFQSSVLHSADFNSATAIRTNFKNALLHGANFRNATFEKVDLTNSNLRNVNFSGSVFQEVNFSGAIFCPAFGKCANNLTPGQMALAWAWKDNLPDFGKLSDLLKPALKRLCDPALRDGYEKRKHVGIPEECW